MDNILRRLDLNLLVTLDILLSEHNVTRAAQRLNLSQPSVSVHLAKLRDIFKDPLLLPGPRGIRPTARAEELREPLRQALESLERALAPASPFDPAKASQTWCVAAADYSESTILRPALVGLRTMAPGWRSLTSLRHASPGRRNKAQSISPFIPVREPRPDCAVGCSLRSDMFWQAASIIHAWNGRRRLHNSAISST